MFSFNLKVKVILMASAFQNKIELKKKGFVFVELLKVT